MNELWLYKDMCEGKCYGAWMWGYTTSYCERFIDAEVSHPIIGTGIERDDDTDFEDEIYYGQYEDLKCIIT